MTREDEDRPSVPGQPAVGADLSKLSVFELKARLSVLQEEMARTEAAIAARADTKAAAEAVFKIS